MTVFDEPADVKIFDGFKDMPEGTLRKNIYLFHFSGILLYKGNLPAALRTHHCMPFQMFLLKYSLRRNESELVHLSHPEVQDNDGSHV